MVIKFIAPYLEHSYNVKTVNCFTIQDINHETLEEMYFNCWNFMAEPESNLQISSDDRTQINILLQLLNIICKISSKTIKTIVFDVTEL